MIFPGQPCELAGLVSDPQQRKAIDRAIATSMSKATEKIIAEIKKR